MRVVIGFALLAIGCRAADSVPGQTGAEGDAEVGLAVDQGDAPGRWFHEPDLQPLIARYLSPEGFLDPEFAAHVAHASAFYGDLFGLQAVADVPRSQILADFVPLHATLTAEDEHSLRLDFAEGFVATFFPESGVRVFDQAVPFSHASFHGDDWRAVRSNIDAFISLLGRAGLADRYLVPNPLYADEQITERQLASGIVAEVAADPTLSAWDSASDAVLLIPEAVHGSPVDLDRLLGVIRRHDVDWLGLEMLFVEQQPLLDRFNESAAGTPEHDAARAELVEYFAEAWNGRAGPKTTGEENPYFKAVEEAHRLGARVVALEGASIAYLLFRYGEAPFGGSVRSQQWATHTPDNGRGILFGGSAHFNSPGSGNVQDFLALVSPERLLVSMSDLLAAPGN